MPFANLTLVLLVGLVPGVLTSVLLKCRRLTFIVNPILGILGACLGAFVPVMLGNDLMVNTNTPEYLIRAVFGAVILVFIASLFRPVRAPTLD